MKRKEQIYANFGLLLVALIWGSGFVVTKIGLDYISPFYMLFYRFLISFLLMSIVFNRKFSLINSKNLRAGIILGIFMFGGFAGQTVGLEYMDAGKQGFIIASNVVMVPFIYWGLAKVRPDKYDVAGALLCFLGLAILSLEGSIETIGRGEILTFISAIFFAFHLTFIGHYTKKHDPILLTLIQMFTASVLALIFSVVKEGDFVVLNSASALPILYLGIFNTLIAFTIQNISQKYTTPTNAAIILSLEAVFSMGLAIIVLGDVVSFRHLIGFTMVFVAVIISQTKLSFLR